MIIHPKAQEKILQMRTKQFMMTISRNKAMMELRAHLLKEERFKENARYESAART